jgi:alpha-D-xyloside xylohydrolase
MKINNINLLAGVLVMGSLLAPVSSWAKKAGYERLKDGVVVTAPDAKVRVRVINEKIMRVSATPEQEFKADSSLVVLPKFQGNANNPQFTVTEKKGTVEVATSQIKAVINEKNGQVKFYDHNGKELLVENQNGRTFTPRVTDGVKGYSVRQTWESLNPDEGIYGLGQHQANEFNYKDKNEELFQYNTKVSVPFVVSTDNYGLLWDSYSLCRWGNPNDYSQLGEVFKLFNKEGKEGTLTGTYIDKEGKTMVRQEPKIYFENLIRGDLNHVINLPQDFDYAGSNVTYEGYIEPSETGLYKFIMYYSGYQTIYIDGKKVVDTRWRTAWNPNSYKFQVNLQAGKKVPIKIEWEPNGAVAYCGLRVYAPVKDGEQLSWWGQMQDMIDYYFIYGKDMDDIIAGYRTLTGKAPIMPNWAMGYWQSREKYNTRDEVLGTVSEFRKRNIPIDNVVIDWLHWKQDSWGSHEFDKERFPDPKGMVDSIHDMNAHVMVSVWPKFYVTTNHYKEFDRNGWMYRGAVRDSIRDWVGPGYLGSFYDAYNPDARKLFWSQMNDHYMPLGIDAWWMDASEPNVRDCIDIEYRKDLMNPTYAGPADKYFNAYALMNAEAIYDGQRGVDPDKRVFLLTRSGFSGQQRYSTATWSGDIGTRWEDMEAQIAAGLNFAVSGVPYWTMDIGGFCVEDRYVKGAAKYLEAGEENDDLKEWRELNTRWYQFGAFAPLFRAHGQWPFREVYNIAPEDHPAYNSIVKYTKLRYNLMPYIYSLAGKTYFDDYTIMRPMVMDFTADLNTRNLKDQYMFGPAFLVAPVYKYGARDREVYFPAGETWYDFYTGKAVKGGQTLKVDAPYETMPLFVRGGSIVPAGGDIQYAAQKSDEPVTIVVYGGRDGDFTIYEDEGTNYNYEKGAFSKIRLEYNDKTNELTIADREGSFPGMQSDRKFNIVKVDATHPVADAIKAKGKLVNYNGRKAVVKL